MSKAIFNTEDYNSSNGMMSSVWGPAMWHFLHTISFNYPIKPNKEDKDNYYNYIISVGKILPCKYCRDNYKKNLKNAKFSRKVLKNRETFSKFIYKLHCEVNNMLCKKIETTYKDIKYIYEHFRSRCTDENKKTRSYNFFGEQG